MLKPEGRMELAVLWKHGASIRELAWVTGHSRNTVRRYLRGGELASACRIREVSFANAAEAQQIAENVYWRVLNRAHLGMAANRFQESVASASYGMPWQPPEKALEAK
jgi:hypothetical protein